MGGCCCCSARRTTSDGPPLYYYYPEDLENEPLSSTRAQPPAVPVVLVNPNLDTSISDCCQGPNTLLPLGHNQPSDTTVPGRDADTHRFETSDTYDGLKGSDCKSFSNFESDSPNAKEKISSLENSMALVTDEEDVCPTCLEEYDTENPRIVTKCGHHFHLSCILEWFERSNTCAICDRVMMVDNMALFDQSL